MPSKSRSVSRNKTSKLKSNTAKRTRKLSVQTRPRSSANNGAVLGISSLTECIKKWGRLAPNEEKLKVEIERALGPVLQQFGLEVDPSYEEYVVTGDRRGFSDAVYGRVVIEYEPPGTLRKKSGLNHTIDQCIKYIDGYAGTSTDPEAEAHKYVGVGIDGQKIFFLKYVGANSTESSLLGFQDRSSSRKKSQTLTGEYLVDGPFNVDTRTTAFFVSYLRSLSRRPLTVEGLTQSFGPSSDIARDLIRDLYLKVLDNQNTGVKVYFSEWKRVFGIVYGKEISKEQEDAIELAKLYRLYDEEYGGVYDLKSLLFCVHTFFAMIMKLLVLELLSFHDKGLSSPVTELATLNRNQLKNKLEHIENGGIFLDFGITNFLEGDFLGWYLALWGETLETGVRSVAEQIVLYEPTTSILAPSKTKDLLKKLYQNLIPKELRHSLGEYYTPDWLAEHVLDKVGFDGTPDLRVLDPSCGSGTFLVEAIKRLRAKLTEKTFSPKETLAKILESVVGFELNPLAVIASRTNYLLSIADLIPLSTDITIPVYMCDSILAPQSSGATVYEVQTTVGKFTLPKEIVDSRKIDIVTSLLSKGVRANHSFHVFLTHLEQKLKITEVETRNTLNTLYERLVELEKNGEDGVWARWLRNAFAPMFVGKFDFIIGNPPWVNWDSLSDEFCAKTKTLWERYGLFTLSGFRARLGGGKKDISMLFVATCVDRFLKDGGKLGYVITQTVFKSQEAGEGFRKFNYDGNEVKVESVDDFVKVQAFDGATNRTATVVLIKGEKTTYPVPYTIWRKTGRGRIPSDASLSEVASSLSKHVSSARPIGTNPLGPWIVGPDTVLNGVQPLFGSSNLQIKAGICTWANGVYWVKILERHPDGRIVVENLNDIGKLENIPKVTRLIEPDLVFPLARGKDIVDGRFKNEIYIINPQDPNTRKGRPIEDMQLRYPETLAYLQQFEQILLGRSGYKSYLEPHGAPFYSIYNVELATVKPIKVYWGRVSSGVEATVLTQIDDPFLGQKVVLPSDGMVVPFDNLQAAQFFSAVLNSTAVNYVIKAYTTIHPDTHVTNNVAIPHFDPQNALHQDIVQDYNRFLNGETNTYQENNEGRVLRLFGLDANIQQEIGNIIKWL